MLERAVGNLFVLAVTLAATPAAQAAQYLLVNRTSAGAWSFEEAQSLSVNGKDKLRSGPLPSGAAATWDSKAIGRLAEVQWSTFRVVRRAPDGSLLARTSDSANWQLLLPEGTNSKTADSAAMLWGASTVTFKKDQKDKSPSAIRLEELYAIVPGPDAPTCAALIATDVSAHQVPGMAEADAFRQMLSLLPEAAKAFPAASASKPIHDYLEGNLSARLKKWQDGDVPVDVLDESIELAKAAGAAFPADQGLSALSAQARSVRAALDRRVAILRALDAGKQSDAFLAAYRDFEIYDKSYPDLQQAHSAHLKASAAEHVRAAQSLQRGGDYLGAIRSLLIAKWRDTKLKEADDLLEQVRLEAARLSAQKFEETRRGVDPRSPAQVQLQRRLLLAEQQMNDGKIADAEKTIQEAEAMDKDEPRIVLLQARLSVARGDLAKAVAFLDNFDGIAVTPQDFAEGERLRASVEYTINASLEKKRTQVEGALDQQQFASALEASADGLKLDNENPDFLYYSAMNACVLRHCPEAEPLLRRYLDVTDSLEGNREQRLAAMQLLRESVLAGALEADAKPANKPDQKTASWFSGTPLGQGVFYDPVSLSFQPRVSRIEASDHLNIAYDWEGNHLRSVHANHEEKQTGGNMARLAGAAVASAAGLSSTLIWKTAQREINDFYFNYYDDAPQILKVSSERTVVQSRRIPISIPGVGIFGPFAGVGALGALGNLGNLGRVAQLGGAGGGGLGALGGAGGLGALGGLGGSGGLGGLSGFIGMGGGIGGAGNSAILSRLAGSGRMSGLSGFSSLGAVKSIAPAHNYSILSDPEGGAKAGFLTLWNDPRLDTRLAFKTTGKRAAVGFSGNHFFEPFAWDGIHLFEFDYDAQGRVAHAWELDEPAAPRLDFTWEGQRLLQLTAHDNSPAGTVVYSRVLNYTGDRLTGEVITSQGSTSHIEYKYDKQGQLVEASAEADHTLDGRSRKVFFVLEDKGKR
jgi:hypothetical protein